MKRDQ